MRRVMKLLLMVAVLILIIKAVSMVIGAVWSVFLIMSTFICICAVIGGSDGE